MNDDAARKRDLFARHRVAPPPAARRRSCRCRASSRRARLLLERHLGLTWIGGEISGCTRAASGHLYFTLKDASAQVRCVFFRHKAQGARVRAARRASPSKCAPRRRSTSARGEFQLNVETVRLAGLGALYERFVQLKAALEAAGLFDAARKRALPRLSAAHRHRHVAARGGVARRADDARAPLPVACRVILYPASVQGAGAAREIAAAIRAANAHASVDVLIVCRGGGSLEDLWAFNEEVVARAVFESRLPIVSGVGHETDFTICDFVADVRAPDADRCCGARRAASGSRSRGTLRRVVAPPRRAPTRTTRRSRAQRLDAARAPARSSRGPSRRSRPSDARARRRGSRARSTTARRSTHGGSPRRARGSLRELRTPLAAGERACCSWRAR